MPQGYNQQHVRDEQRRDLLKALGVVGTVAVGGATLEEVRSAAEPATSDELAPIGQAINADLAGSIDASLIATQQAELAAATQGLEAVEQRGLPTEAPRDEFVTVAEAGRPVYDHLVDVGFFESTTEHLPEFTPEYLQASIQTFIGSETLAEPLADLGLEAGTGVDMLAAVISNAEEINNQHWIASDKIARDEITFGGAIPDVTRGVAGGSLLWLEDLDQHLWQKELLITDEILSDAVWHGQTMAAGFHLMAQAAHAIGEGVGEYSNTELTALLSVGFAVQTISQVRLPENVYWITEGMRKPREA